MTERPYDKAERFVDVIADALLGAAEDSDTATNCPVCGGTLIVYATLRQTDHIPPLCPEWAQYMENWQGKDISAQR